MTVQSIDVFNLFEHRSQELKGSLESAQVALGKCKTAVEEPRGELSKLQGILETMETSGLATAEVKEKIRIQCDEIAKIEGEGQELRERIQSIQCQIDAFEPTEWLLAYAKKNLEMECIPVIQKLDELWVNSRVRLNTDDGAPVDVTVDFSIRYHHPTGGWTQISRDVPIIGSSRSLKGWLPSELRWIPRNWLPQVCQAEIDYQDASIYLGDESQEGNKALQPIYYLSSEDRLMPAVSTFHWKEGQKVVKTRDIRGDYPSVTDVIENDLEPIKEGVSLEMEYPEGSLRKHIQCLILDATIPKCEANFPESDGYLKSNEIYKMIQPYWDEFVNGPWMPLMYGLLANLKYYCECGERPRFYSKGLQNSFGFKLRTRDHSWIHGAIFLLSEKENQAEEALPFELNRRQFRCGRMCVSIGPEERIDLKGEVVFT